MALSDSQTVILHELVRRIPRGVTWCVIGSTDSVLRGLEDDPADIDILTTDSGAERFRDAFSDGFVRTRNVSDSRIDEYRVQGEELEVIFADPAKAHEQLVDLDNIEMASASEPAVPLLPLEKLLCVYRKIDKHETADRLQAEFDPTDG